MGYYLITIFEIVILKTHVLTRTQSLKESVFISSRILTSRFLFIDVYLKTKQINVAIYLGNANNSTKMGTVKIVLDRTNMYSS